MITWQVHVCGSASAELETWCKENGVPLHVYSWHLNHGRSGLLRDAAYVLRPDTYIALVDPSGSVLTLDTFFKERGIRFKPEPLSQRP